jgi:hypothetical protein
MTDNHVHEPQDPDIVPDSFNVQALERRVMALANEKYILDSQLTQAEARNLFQADVITALKNQLQAGVGGIIDFLDDVDVDTLDKYLANDVDLGESLAAVLISRLKEMAHAQPGEGS